MIINETLQKEYGLGVHVKESRESIRKSNISQKLTLVLSKKAQYTNFKHKKSCVEVEDNTPVAMLDISDNEVNRRMKKMVTITMTTKTAEIAMTRKGKAILKRRK